MKAHQFINKFKASKFPLALTLLAVVGGPAAVSAVIVEGGLDAWGPVLHDPGANIGTLFGLLISSNKVVKICIHNEGPVNRIQVAELSVLLDPYRASCDVPQAVEANVL